MVEEMWERVGWRLDEEYDRDLGTTGANEVLRRGPGNRLVANVGSVFDEDQGDWVCEIPEVADTEEAREECRKVTKELLRGKRKRMEAAAERVGNEILRDTIEGYELEPTDEIVDAGLRALGEEATVFDLYTIDENVCDPEITRSRIEDAVGDVLMDYADWD